MDKRRLWTRFWGVCFLLVGSMMTDSVLGAGSIIQLTPLSVTNSLPESRSAAPLTWSVPLAPEDNVLTVGTLVLMRGGTEVPAQFTPMARWGGTPQDAGKPLAWVLVDAQADLAPAETSSLSLGIGQPAALSSPLRIAQNDDDHVVVETGAATYSMSKKAFRFFDTVTLQDGLSIKGAGGILFEGGLVSNAVAIRPEHVGARRLSLMVNGRVEGNLMFTARLHFYANLAEVKVDFRLENLNPPEVDYHGQPQANDYGAARSVNFDDLSLVIPAGTANNFRLPTGELGAGGERLGTFGERLVVIQESSGDANWNVLQGMAPRLQSGVRKRASTLLVDGTIENGPNQIAGWLDANGVTVAVERAWQNFPKALRAVSGSVEIGLFPGEFSRNHELRPGEYKTHTFWVRHHHGAGDVGARARSFLSTLRLQPPVEKIVASQAAGLFAPRMDALFPDYENGTDYQLVTSPEWREEYESQNLLDAMSRTQHYGWVDYGDIPTDFEGKFSPYNLKYDGMRGLILHALRNANNETWWQLAAAGARHLADIDIQHSQVRGYTAPRSWYEGGMYGHGYHDEDGRLNPHRNYQNPVTYLAGPNAGMLLWALISGDTLVLDSALELADNLYWKTVNSDYYADFYGQMPEESRRCAQDAGLQVCSEGECYGYEPADGSRTGGNVVKAMLLAYMATGDAAYLNLISHLSAYVHCMETQVTGPGCDRFHFQTTFVRNLGHYLLFLDHVSLPDDTVARDLLQLRMDYMVNTLWDSGNREFRMCYDGAELFPFHDNWLFPVADAFAVGSLVLGPPELLEDYALSLFLDGARNQFYEGSALSYHSTKEFVNQVGFGNIFLFAWNQRTPGSCSVSLAPTSQSFTHLGGTGLVRVTASDPSCVWKAQGNASWITITGGETGTGNGNVTYTVAANTSREPREGTITVGERVFAVRQEGVPWRTLTVSKTGLGAGAVSSSPAGILCGADCASQSAAFNQGTVVTLAAAPAAGSLFSGWQGGGCTGKSACKVSLSENMLVKAKFDVERLPDLSSTWSRVSRAKSGSRYRLRATLTVKNGGQYKAPSSKVRVYLSDNAALDAADQLLGTVSITSLAQGKAISKSLSYTIAGNPQGKYLIAQVDPQNSIRESSEDNNVSASGAIP